jgi:SNF2 family DNA or RNA helicase
MSRPRLLLADGVGLGKTIQAGLVVTELIARRLVHRILIVSPAGPLMDQWKEEMEERFGLRFEVLDRARIEEIRKSQELGVNPFDFVPLALASIDFLKQERVLERLEQTGYDIVISNGDHTTARPRCDWEREIPEASSGASSGAQECALLSSDAQPLTIAMNDPTPRCV